VCGTLGRVTGHAHTHMDRRLGTVRGQSPNGLTKESVVNINKSEVLRLAGHRLGKRRRAVLIGFLDKFRDNTTMTMEDWLVRFKEHLKYPEKEIEDNG
jgi:hypothetical protein